MMLIVTFDHPEAEECERLAHWVRYCLQYLALPITVEVLDSDE